MEYRVRKAFSCLALLLVVGLGPAGCARVADPAPPELETVVVASSVDPARMTPDLSAERLGYRDEAHAALAQGEYHDAGIYLIEYGDITSVPLLLEALRTCPSSEDGVVCTYGHLAQALRAITGEDFGVDYEAWAAWWSEYEAQRSR